MVRSTLATVTSTLASNSGEVLRNEDNSSIKSVSSTGVSNTSAAAAKDMSTAANDGHTLGSDTEYKLTDVPDFSTPSLDRSIAIVAPSQNLRITWTMELFSDEEHLAFMYRILLKDQAGNLDNSYLLATNENIFLLDAIYRLQHRLPLSTLSYGRGSNWQTITLFHVEENGTTDQIDVITGCEAVSRGIMEGLSVNRTHQVAWAMEESYSQLRLKYHVGRFLQEQGLFSLDSIDDLHYCIVAWTPLSAERSTALRYSIAEGKMGLKEPTLFTYVWNEYYFILDKQGQLSLFDVSAGGTIKKQFTVIGSRGCRRMERAETTKKFAFKFISEEGEEVMLNCTTAVEREKWMSAVSRAAMEIPELSNETGFGLMCSAVVNKEHVMLVREGYKTPYTLDSTLIQEITHIQWHEDEEFCVIKNEKSEWLVIFRDIYERNKLMEAVWERWRDILHCEAPQLLFKRLSSQSELQPHREAIKKYKEFINVTDNDNQASEFECI